MSLNQRQWRFRNSGATALGLCITVLLSVAFSRGQSAQGVQELTSAHPIKRSIAGGEAHNFRMRLHAGEFVCVAIDQRGIDLVVSFFGPKRELLNYFNSPDLTQGVETVSWVVTVAGNYRVEVRAKEKTAVGGRYELSIVEHRPQVTVQDRDRVAAELAFMEGEELRNKWTANSLESSLTKYAEALRLSRSAGDRRLEGTALNIIGLVYSSLGDEPRALHYYQQAHPVRRAGGDFAGEGQSLHNVGSTYSNMEESKKALEYYDRALKANAVAGDRLLAGVVFTDCGIQHLDLGQLQQALANFEQALAAFRELGSLRLQAHTLSKLGSIYYDLGDAERSLEYSLQSLSLFHSLGIRREEVFALNFIAWIHLNARDYKKAYERSMQALRLHREVADWVAKADTLLVIAQYSSDIGKYQEALEYYSSVLAGMRKFNERSRQAVALLGIGRLHFRQENYQKAVENFNQALVIFQNVNNRRGRGATLSDLMYAWKELEDPRLAVLYGKQAVNFYQEIRGNLRGLEKGLQESFLRITEHPYRVLADLLISEGRLSEAQQVLDLLKEEEFSKLVRRSGSRQLNVPYSAAEEEAISIINKLASIGSERSQLKQNEQKLQPAEAERLNRLEQQIKVANRELRRAIEALSNAESTTTNRLDSLQKEQTLMRALRELGPGTVALYTVIATESQEQQEKDQPAKEKIKVGWIILITPDFRKAYPIDVAELEQTVFSFREALRTPAYDPRPLAHRLYNMLFLQTSEKQKNTLAEDLNTYLVNSAQKTLMWSLDGVLRYIPMAALHDGKQYLIERYRNVVFNTASIESLKDPVSSQWTVLGLGVTEKRVEGGITFPALEGAERELRAIISEQGVKTRGILPGKIRLNEEFNHQSMINDLRAHYPVVHVASHFSFNATRPEESFLLLGSERLTVEEMRDMSNPFENVELLTLSACDTAVGAGNGKEVEGFAYTAQALGAKSVIASLWPVSDEGTDELMIRFYLKRAQTPQMPKGEAFRQAQLSLLYGETTDETSESQNSGSKRAKLVGSNAAKLDLPRYEFNSLRPLGHPHYWAPFILIGNWK